MAQGYIGILQLRTNNGDDRMKAHDVFPSVCYPDLFWKMVRDDIDGTWYMFDPHEISVKKDIIWKIIMETNGKKIQRMCA